MVSMRDSYLDALALNSHAGFMGELVPFHRKALAVYPLFLFYTSIGWLILIAAKR